METKPFTCHIHGTKLRPERCKDCQYLVRKGGIPLVRVRPEDRNVFRIEHGTNCHGESHVRIVRENNSCPTP